MNVFDVYQSILEYFEKHNDNNKKIHTSIKNISEDINELDKMKYIK